MVLYPSGPAILSCPPTCQCTLYCTLHVFCMHSCGRCWTHTHPAFLRRRVEDHTLLLVPAKYPKPCAACCRACCCACGSCGPCGSCCASCSACRARCGACCDACCCCQPARACLALVAPQHQPHQQQRVRAPHSWQRPLGHVATEEVERVVPSRRGLAASLRSAPRSDELWRRRTSPRLLWVRHWRLHEPQARELPLVLRHVVEARELICGQRHQPECRHHDHDQRV